jgi:FHS family L-fucose permease-like MFS transporter
MKSFEITRLKAGLIQSAFYLGYFTFSLPAAFVLRRFGFRVGLITGLGLYGIGALLFWPAAIFDKYGAFLCALFVIAAGLAFLETGAGSFITLLGDQSTSERRLNFAQAFNPPGTIAGALIGTIFVFSGVEPNAGQINAMRVAGTYRDFLHHETMRVIAPYLVLSAVAFLFAVLLAKIRLPESIVRAAHEPGIGAAGLRALLGYSHFRNAVIAQFFYVGAQVATWSYLIQYARDYTHQSDKAGGYLLSISLALFAIGRFVSTYLMSFYAPNRLLAIFAAASAALMSFAIIFPGGLGLSALISVSFFMSLMFPTIFALGVKDLGRNTSLGASFIIMAIIGGAVITPLVGWLAEVTHNMAAGFWVVVGSFCIVACFAIVGSSRSGSPTSNPEQPVVNRSS